MIFNDMLFLHLMKLCAMLSSHEWKYKKLCFEISCSSKAGIGKHSKQGFYVIRKRKKIAFKFIAMKDKVNLFTQNYTTKT